MKTGRPPRVAKPESKIESEILEYLHLRGCAAWPTHGPRNRPVTLGMADILGVLPGGRALAVEVKTDTGILRPAQVRFLAEVNARRGLGFVARSIEDVGKELDMAGFLR